MKRGGKKSGIIALKFSSIISCLNFAVSQKAPFMSEAANSHLKTVNTTVR